MPLEANSNGEECKFSKGRSYVVDDYVVEDFGHFVYNAIMWWTIFYNPLICNGHIWSLCYVMLSPVYLCPLSFCI